MKHLFSILATMLIMLFASSSAHAQNFKGKQMEQIKSINYAHKKGRVTEVEFQKLMKEQDVITATIDKANADKVLTAKEKNHIFSKQKRAAKRLKKYKVNGEVY